MVIRNRQREQRVRRRQRGAALLMCLFLVFMVSASIVNIVRTETLQLAATRNSIEYEQALYWANAGVHHACVELGADFAWRGTVTDGVIPPGSPLAGYTATAADGAEADQVVITSTGYSGRGERTVNATIEL